MVKILFATFLLFISGEINSQVINYTNSDTTGMIEDSSKTDIEISGLILDRTISKVGNDFFNQFYSSWSSFGITNPFTVYVTEKPSPSIGSQISIEIEELIIFQQFVQPRGEMIKSLAEYAAASMVQYIFNYEQIQADLSSEDLEGSGIY